MPILRGSFGIGVPFRAFLHLGVPVCRSAPPYVAFLTPLPPRRPNVFFFSPGCLACLWRCVATRSCCLEAISRCSTARSSCLAPLSGCMACLSSCCGSPLALFGGPRCCSPPLSGCAACPSSCLAPFSGCVACLSCCPLGLFLAPGARRNATSKAPWAWPGYPWCPLRFYLATHARCKYGQVQILIICSVRSFFARSAATS